VDPRPVSVGIGAYLYPTGDIRKDFALIREFYGDKTGLRPEKQGPTSASGKRRTKGRKPGRLTPWTRPQTRTLAAGRGEFYRYALILRPVP
jgi:hypothetical protein